MSGSHSRAAQGAWPPPSVLFLPCLSCPSTSPPPRHWGIILSSELSFNFKGKSEKEAQTHTHAHIYHLPRSPRHSAKDLWRIYMCTLPAPNATSFWAPRCPGAAAQLLADSEAPHPCLCLVPGGAHRVVSPPSWRTVMAQTAGCPAPENKKLASSG